MSQQQVYTMLKLFINRNTQDAIIFSKHQPRYSIFKIFDTITLLSKGDIFYHEQAKNLLTYFSHQGYSREPHNNPIDFVIGVLIGAKENSDKMENLKLAYKNASMHQLAMNPRKQ
ncbi:unnamed protein product [Rotaria magnacalcarata]|uniref:ABC transporter family G domain-containing protein n=1 Tax=Rotaria magnacalcarata TaxID=392030 RepID=A0A816Y4P6_9BILA|nr:unnamed protein product [Rotaria magnacalcarata]CAF2156141.1 unnamed protein product [Rotaria magnacalcarata]